METIFKSAVILLMLAIPMRAQQFSSSMREIFGQDFPHYQWLSYPLDNFGVGTAYRDTRETANDKHFLCATFDCLNIEPVPASNNDEGLNKQWLLVASSPTVDKGYADYGCGGPVQDALSRHSESAIQAFFSQMMSVIGISLDLKKSRETTVTLVLKSACKRLLNGRIQEYLEGLKRDDYGIRRAAVDGELILIKGDIVIDKLEIKIHASQDLKTQLNAKLAGAGAKKFGSDSKFGIELSHDQSGDYYLRTTSPVIVGVLAARQPLSLSAGHKASNEVGRAAGTGDVEPAMSKASDDGKSNKTDYKHTKWNVQSWDDTTVPLPR
jgi:hypothetical protein